jgi:hypothetical protein
MRTLFVSALAAAVVGCSSYVSPQTSMEACTGAGGSGLACLDKSSVNQTIGPEPTLSNTGLSTSHPKPEVAARAERPPSVRARHKTDLALSTVKSTAPAATPEPTAAPKAGPAATEVKPSAPQIELAATKAEPAAPKVELAAIKAEPVAPKIELAAIKAEPVAPKIELATIKAEPVAPKSERATIKAEPVAPKIELAAIKAEPTAPKVELATIKAEPVAPKIELAAIKAEPVAPKVEAPTSGRPAETADQVLAKAKATIASRLDDPKSAEFGEMKRAIRTNPLGKSVDIICGYVKGKNASGESTGDWPFLYLVKDDEAYVANGPPTSIAATAYRNICNWAGRTRLLTNDRGVR